MDGRNPYTTPVSDVYDGPGPGARIHYYTYPPATLYLQLAGYALGDVRLASVLAEAVFVAALIALAETGRRRRAPPGTGALLALLFVVQPRGLLVIQQAWTEPLILMCLGATLWLWKRQRSGLAAGVFGFLLSLKQSLLFLALAGLVVERRLTRIAVAGLVALATLVPFLIWDASSLVTSGLLFHFDTGYREDALTIWAPLSAAFGITPTRWWTIAVGLTATTVCVLAFRSFVPIRRFLWVSSLSTLTMFALGDKAFCNYYYFVGGMLLLLAAEELTTTPAPAAPDVPGVPGVPVRPTSHPDPPAGSSHDRRLSGWSPWARAVPRPAA
jgi:hypothetical protein